jgi:hypothetical protein
MPRKEKVTEGKRASEDVSFFLSFRNFPPSALWPLI